jgi:hypothetical protein
MSFGDIYRRDTVTFVQVTRHKVSGEAIESDPIEVKAYVEWYNGLRQSETGANPKQDALMLVAKNVDIKQGDVIKKVVMQDGTTYENDLIVQKVSPQGGFTITHKEVLLGG